MYTYTTMINTPTYIIHGIFFSHPVFLSTHAVAVLSKQVLHRMLFEKYKLVSH